MKVIFLDFDGVLNSEKYVRNCGHFGVVLDPSRMELLKKVVEATEAKIVLSTSWRKYWSPTQEACDETGFVIDATFRQYGIEILDKTPILSSQREKEIEMWLKDHPQVENFVVFDDAFLDGTGFLKDHFVKTTNYKNGLDEENVQNAIKILNG